MKDAYIFAFSSVVEYSHINLPPSLAKRGNKMS